MSGAIQMTYIAVAGVAEKLCAIAQQRFAAGVEVITSG